MDSNDEFEDQSFDLGETEKFIMPEPFFEKLYEFTGTGNSKDGGFIVAYVTQDGKPIVKSKSGSQIVEMGLRKAMEEFLIAMDDQDNVSLGKGPRD